MSLLEATKAGVEVAFSAATEFVVVGDYYSVTKNPTYDPVTEAKAEPTPITGVRFLPTNNQLEEREASPVAVTDLKFLVPGVDLNGAIPKSEDWCRVWAKRYNVVLAKAVPGQSLWIIFVRQA